MPNRNMNERYQGNRGNQRNQNFEGQTSENSRKRSRSSGQRQGGFDRYDQFNEGRDFGRQDEGGFGREGRSADYSGMSDFNRGERFQGGRSRIGQDRISSESFERGQGQKELSTRGGAYGKGPKGWKRSDDKIKDEVSEVLWRDSQVDASDIEVSVKEGCVILKGIVDGRETKRAAERCIENLSGVDDVQNELRVNRETEASSDMNRGRGESNLGKENQQSLS